VRGHGGGGLATGGRARPQRVVSVGRFADGLSRRRRRRAPTRLGRVGGVVLGVLVALLVILFVAARLAGHL